VSETLFEELKRYVGFAEADEQALRALHPIARPQFERISEVFYQRILQHEAARKALVEGESMVGRLRHTLVEWMDKLLTGPWDHEYYEMRARIGRKHVGIALPQHYMFGAMNVLRQELNAVVDEAYRADAGQMRAARLAVGKILDLELAIMLHTYREDLLSQQARVERLSTFGQLVGSIGHELRNPLGVIESSLYILRGRIGQGDERANKHVGRIGEQLWIANAIISDLLDMIRDKPLAAESVRLRSVVEAAAQQLQLSLQTEALEHLPEVRGDPSQLRQVFVNLLQNAQQAGGADGSIHLDAETTASGVAIGVSDEGPGVDPSVRARLFEPLVTTRQKGIGLGLALVKRIVERHGGTLAYEPRGKGARFVVRLPRSPPWQEGLLAVLPKPAPLDRLTHLLENARRDGLVALVDTDEAGHPGKAARRRGEAGALTPRVLLVDDNAGLVDNLREALEDEGYSVATAGAVSQALQEAAAGFDVALVDLKLPDGDGTALTERLRREHPDASIVILTGNATVETAVAAVRAGAFAYLVKPCSTSDLLLTLEQALRQVRLQAEKRELARRASVAERLAAVGTMTAGLSHEIRNPLNAAALQLVVLERRVRKLPQAEQTSLLEPLQLVRDEITRLEHLLQDFLQFARPRELSTAPLELEPLIAAVSDRLAGEAERRGIKLVPEIPKDLPKVYGEDERLRQVLMNLALNALEATPKGGQVRITAQRRSDEVWVAVDDSGPGIDGEIRERIFEPFFSTKASGSGLGLPIVHAIVTQHGGAVGAETSPLGGARFWFTLRRAA